MKDNFKNKKQEMRAVEKTVEIANSPTAKLLTTFLQQIPILGPSIEFAERILLNFQNHKRQEFCDIIIKSKMITTEKVSDVEFLVNFAKTINAIDRLATNDKVKYFGNLLKNCYIENDKVNADFYDEMLNIIKNLTLLQIKILVYWNKSDDKNWDDFKGRVMKEFNFTESQFYGQLNSLSKTGVCRQQGGFTFAAEDIYVLTDYFYEIKKYVLEITAT